MFQFDNGKMAKIERLRQPTFYTDFRLFFSDVKHTLDASQKDVPELRLMAMWKQCREVGREYLRRLAIHKALVGAVWHAWSNVGDSNWQVMDKLWILVRAQHDVVKHETMAWLTRNYAQLETMARTCPWLSCYLNELKFTAVNS